jgi:hypothetical protein
MPILLALLWGVSMNGTKNWDRERIFRAKQFFRPGL